MSSSVLSAFSKIIEKSKQIQTQEYLDKNGLPCQYQSGVRRNFSSESCLNLTILF